MLSEFIDHIQISGEKTPGKHLRIQLRCREHCCEQKSELGCLKAFKDHQQTKM